ncbi:hypothetical protein JKP88DRAFT_201313 [Tribonema minus]|uniref:HD/PDEase domain-containing protein n=1 Tax=Tribonema minus TaxID=303371 RepID=A0A835YQ16_9STRA|nr:hypothetical protein JKP88DRAFT_201313 [Tribonema minus]
MPSSWLQEHGSLQLEPALVEIMNTPQFNRLHGLAQLGTSSYVFRDATHTRFAHSVGVAHLAEKMVTNFMRYQPYLNITKEDLLCVQIAGLCHDLGHGPYSHIWDNNFMKRMGIDWKHEQGSIDMLRFLLRDNNIDLRKYGLQERDLVFIEELIMGVGPEKREGGRDSKKGFLYDVVNNVRSGLDVDKLDYFKRDTNRTGVGAAPAIGRFFDLARVCWARDANHQPHRMICYPEKMASEIAILFRHRMSLHQTVYQHHGTKALELMLVDALCLAEPHFRVRGSVDAEHPDGRWRLSEAVSDMRAFTGLKDSVIDLIENAEAPALRPAQAIIQRWQRRDLYKCADLPAVQAEIVEVARRALSAAAEVARTGGACAPVREERGNAERAAADGEETEEDDDEEGEEGEGGEAAAALTEEDLILDILHIHCGQGDRNPMAALRFYRKWDHACEDRPDRPLGRVVEKEAYINHLPRQLSIRQLRVFVRDGAKAEAAKAACEDWAEAHRLRCPEPEEKRDEDE